MQLPAEVNGNFRSDKIHHRPFYTIGTAVFEYRVKKDSVIYSDRGDTTITFGIIIPRARMIGTKSIRQRSFGNDVAECRITYNTHDIYLESESHSLLGDIILPPDKYKRDSEQETTRTTYYYRHFNSIAVFNEDTAFFNYEEIRAKKDIDTAAITGFISCKEDSLILKANYLSVTQNKKKQKYIYILEGFGFYKHGRMIAFLQYAPQVEPGKEKLHIHNDASVAERILISSYFTLFYDRL